MAPDGDGWACGRRCSQAIACTHVHMLGRIARLKDPFFPAVHSCVLKRDGGRAIKSRFLNNHDHVLVFYDVVDTYNLRIVFGARALPCHVARAPRPERPASASQSRTASRRHGTGTYPDERILELVRE